MNNLLEGFEGNIYYLFEAIFEEVNYSKIKELGWEVISKGTEDVSDSYDFTDNAHKAVLMEISTGDFYEFNARTQSYSGTDVDWPMRKVEKKTKEITYFE